MQENDKDVGKENDDLHQAADFQAQTFHLQMPTMRGRYYDVVYVWNQMEIFGHILLLKTSERYMEWQLLLPILVHKKTNDAWKT